MLFPIPILMPLLGAGGGSSKELQRADLIMSVVVVTAMIGGGVRGIYAYLSPTGCFMGRPCNGVGEVAVEAFIGGIATGIALMLFLVGVWAVRNVWRALRDGFDGERTP